MSPNRRDFIHFFVTGGVAAGWPIHLTLLAAEQPSSPPAVGGEDNLICHQVRDGKIFSRPPASARHDVVIVGGGVSGLTAAYLLRQRDFLLLEKEPHWGGNSYLMDYQGNAYATGGAFLEKSEIAYEFAQQIGLQPLPINNWDGSIIKGEFIPDTWGEGLAKLPYSASVREGFKKFRKDILAINVERRSKELYGVPFTDFMKGYPDEIKQWWDTYGPSNWGATSADTAAALGISSLQSMAEDKRADDRYTWPGGLGAISKKLSEILHSEYSDRMHNDATTVAVVPARNSAQVTNMQGRKLKTVAEKTVIMAPPKFITRRIVEGLPDKQNEAMRQMRYVPLPRVNP